MRHSAFKIVKPSDAFLPAALLIAALLGRSSLALGLFMAYCAVKLCALATSDGLRIAFARQPSIRKVQGSAVLALLLQMPGAIIAALIARITGQVPPLYSLIACGLLLNIERVFYEYLYALGETSSATLYRSITALLILTGLLLCAPSSNESTLPSSIEAAWLLTSSGVCAMVGLALSLALGRRPKPRMNVEVLRCAPVSMLQAALYPAAGLIALHYIAPAQPAAVPLFSGLILYELCRSPFRRTQAEARPMNQALLIVCIAASAIAVAWYFLPIRRVIPMILPVCLTVILAALCAFALFGSIRLRRRDEA